MVNTSRILGPDGQPIRIGELREPQTAHLTSLHHEVGNHPSRGLTPSRLAQILDAAEQGDIIGQYELFEDMEEKDGHIMAEMGKRRRAVQGLEWQIVPPDNATKAEKDAAENQKKGDAFLVDNAKKEGVKTTASGLQYQVEKLGNGPKPKDTDVVKVHYTGTLTDGTKFDSSVDRGEPATFPLNQVIPGWTEGVQLMPVGSKFKFFLPSKLAYGEHGAGSIPANAVLVFDVELLAIEKPTADDAKK